MFNLNYALKTNQLSPSSFIGARATSRSKKEDYESGGVALNNPTQPFNYKWKAVSSGESITLFKRVDNLWVMQSEIPLLHTDFSFTFDQNMNPVIAYTFEGIGYIRYFEGQVNQYISKNIGAAILTPRITLDDKRHELLTNSEIICAYIRLGTLRVRKQSENYNTETILPIAGTFSQLVQVGMAANFRLLFELS